jgi:hypothetical protein
MGYGLGGTKTTTLILKRQQESDNKNMTDTEATTRTCKRPTKTDTPCAARLWDPAHRACKRHETPEDLAFAEGYKAGEESVFVFMNDIIAKGAEFHEMRIASLEARLKTHESQQEQVNFRLKDSIGRQIVRVNLAEEGKGESNYAYTWNGEELLTIGDSVRIPSPWSPRETWKVKVTGLGTSYTGSLTAIIEKIG